MQFFEWAGKNGDVACGLLIGAGFLLVIIFGGMYFIIKAFRE